MDPHDTHDHDEEWTPQEPAPDFADRVMRRLEGEASASDGAALRVRTRRVGIASALALAAAMALAIGWRGGHARDRGEAIAADRTQMALGGRAVAVLERGAHVAWAGDVVSQDSGDVFYRVEPGGAFRVHTPAGEVDVKGTCFRVQVREAGEAGSSGKARSEDDVNGRDAKAGAIGAALSAIAFVSVYEGKVAVSRASQSVTLSAGESARADGTGVHRGSAASSDGAMGAAGAAGGDRDPLLAANANLADSVREYKQRLEAIEAQKATIARQLAEAQKKLAVAENDGQAAVAKDPYDLSQDDWKEMAAQGRVRAKMPCTRPESFNYSAKDLQKLGLAPGDAPAIKDALAQSAKRQWDLVRPLCVKALQGNAAIAEKLGQSTCTSLAFDSSRQSGEDVDEDLRQVAEIRAGLRPMPGDGGSPMLKMLYGLSGEAKVLEQDLAQSVGPDDAHRFVFNDGETGCWQASSWSSGPRPVLPPGK